MIAMKTKTLLTALVASALSAGSVSAGAFLDDFSTDTSGDYTKFVLLDTGADGDGAANSSDTSLVVSGGNVTATTTLRDDVEQQVYVRNGSSLDIGEELLVDLVTIAGNRELGIFVGTSSDISNALGGTNDTRQDFLYIGTGSTVQAAGFDDTTYLGVTPHSASDGDTLFIARTGASEYELGFYDSSDGSARIVVLDRTGADAITGIDGSAVGFYADVRAAGSLSIYDNLRIVPEPTSLALLGLGGLLMARRRNG